MRAARVATKEPTSRHVPFNRRTMFIDSISANSSKCIAVAATARDTVSISWRWSANAHTADTTKHTKSCFCQKRNHEKIETATAATDDDEPFTTREYFYSKHTYGCMCRAGTYTLTKVNRFLSFVLMTVRQAAWCNRISAYVFVFIVPLCIHFGFLVRSIGS